MKRGNVMDRIESIFITTDGKRFGERHEAMNHQLEIELEEKAADLGLTTRATKWWNGFGGYRLRKRGFDLESVGVWDIYGEDDEMYSGKFILRAEGTLRQVIEHATSLPKFYTYGSGGRIELHKPENVVDLS